MRVRSHPNPTRMGTGSKVRLAGGDFRAKVRKTNVSLVNLNQNRSSIQIETGADPEPESASSDLGTIIHSPQHSQSTQNHEPEPAANSNLGLRV